MPPVDYEYLRSLVAGDITSPDLLQAIARRTDARTLAELLKHEIQRKKQHIRYLQDYSNALVAPVHSLPPELLASVMHWYAASTDSQFSLGWTKLLFVCRKWRDAGESEPSLWSWMDFSLSRNGAGRLRVQLQRSASAPICVKVYISSGKHLLTYPLDPQRLRSLHVYGGDIEIPLFLAAHTPSGPAYPLLNDIKLHVLSPTTDTGPGIYPLDGLLSSVTSEINVLDLHGAAVRWQFASQLRAVRFLKTYVNYFDLPAAVDALAHCLQLEILSLIISPRRESPRLARSDKVYSPLLQHVQLDGDSTACMDFLFALVLPPRASIDFVGPFDSRDIEALGIPSYLQKHYQTAQARPTRGLCISTEFHNYGAPASLTVAVFSQAALHAGAGPIPELSDKSPCFRIGVAATIANVDEAYLGAMSILHAVPTHGVTDLYDKLSMDLLADQWTAVLDLLPALATVTVRPGRSGAALMSALIGGVQHTPRRVVSHVRLECGALLASYEVSARGAFLAQTNQVLFQILLYASQAKACGSPLATIELAADRCRELIPKLLDARTRKQLGEILTVGLVCTENEVDEDVYQGDNSS